MRRQRANGNCCVAVICQQPNKCWNLLTKQRPRNDLNVILRNPSAERKAQAPNTSKQGPSASTGAIRKRQPCEACSEDHPLYYCPQFLALGLNGRNKFVKDRKLCANCLRRGHNSDQCADVTCRLEECRNNKRHNSTLCPNKELKKPTIASAVVIPDEDFGRTTPSKRGKPNKKNQAD